MFIIKEVAFWDDLNEIMEQFPKGVFLTTKNEQEVNTMTIGWGTIGVMWNKPVFQIMIRSSRHTYDFLGLEKEFTLSIPIRQDFKQALAYCGANSGRNQDKLKECNLHILNGRKVDVPVIGGCKRYYECKVLAKKLVEAEDMIDTINQSYYETGDFHTIFYGEIITSYEL